MYSVSSGSINLQFRILEDLYRSLVIKVTYCYHSLSDFNQNIDVTSVGVGKLPDPWHSSIIVRLWTQENEYWALYTFRVLQKEFRSRRFQRRNKDQIKRRKKGWKEKEEKEQEREEKQKRGPLKNTCLCSDIICFTGMHPLERTFC